jgi:hypothetical protein
MGARITGLARVRDCMVKGFFCINFVHGIIASRARKEKNRGDVAKTTVKYEVRLGGYSIQFTT